MRGRRGNDTDGELWVFGYGSLMWRPGFEFTEAVHARLTGWRRCFCVYSTYYRGDERRPGLVLGLDRGGVCEGVAYRVAPDRARATLDYLRAREMISGVYQEATVPVALLGAERREVTALTYIAERAHPGYAGRKTLHDQARLIRGARGKGGANVDYLLNTLLHLSELGIRERELERLAAMTSVLAAHEKGPERVRGRLLVRLDRGGGDTGHRLRPGDRRRFLHRMWLDGRARMT